MREKIIAVFGSIFSVETLLGVISTLLLIFLTPIGRQLVERRFSRKPAFLVRSPVLRSDLFLTVEPLNSIARKNKPLGASFSGFIIPQIAVPTRIGGKLLWQVNLSKTQEINALLKEGTITVQFFHDVDQKSDSIPLQYAPGTTSVASEENFEPRVVEARSVEELLLELRSNSKINVAFDRATVTNAFPLETPNLKWIKEFDGHELQIVGITNFEITGNLCEILAVPRYAHVFTFRDCHNLRLRGMTLGHSEPGYCVGGVLRFTNCSSIKIDDCDLFGCGTYGLELSHCHQVSVERSIVRNCTYGILKFNNVREIDFVDCRFAENEKFDLITIQGEAKDLFFRRCKFISNQSKGNLIDFEGESRNSRVVLTECDMKNNKFVAVSNKINLVSMDHSISPDNTIGGNHWLARRNR